MVGAAADFEDGAIVLLSDEPHTPGLCGEPAPFHDAGSIFGWDIDPGGRVGWDRDVQAELAA